MTGSFPKSARLLSRRDFQFRPFERFQTQNFSFVYTQQGLGRMGISISKKILRRAAARNRVRRLLREAYRTTGRWPGVDVHVVGRKALETNWDRLKAADVRDELGALAQRLGKN